MFAGFVAPLVSKFPAVAASPGQNFDSKVLVLHFCSDPNGTGGVFTSRFTLTQPELELLRFGQGGEDKKKDVWDSFFFFFFFLLLFGRKLHKRWDGMRMG